MREADLTDGRSGRDPGSGGESWRPLAHHLVERFAAPGGSDEGMERAAIATILKLERLLDPQRPDFSSLIVPLVIRALRRYRREQIRSRPASARPIPALQLAIADAESELSRHLRHSPTVAEVADYLDVAQHQIVAGLEAGWSAGSDVLAPG
jgi:RNA polymerase sigma-B factor